MNSYDTTAQNRSRSPRWLGAKNMNAAQLLAGRTSRLLASSAGRSDAVFLGGRRSISFSYEKRTIATLTRSEYLITGRIRQRQRVMSISSIRSPYFVDIRAHGSSSSRGNNQGRSESSSASAIVGNDNTNVNSSATKTTMDTSSETGAVKATTSDPSMVTWVDDYLPPSIRPYAHLSRMDKPIGTWLLLWPCYWSTAMAAGMPQGGSNATEGSVTPLTPTLLEVLPDPKLLGLFTVGAFVMRGAGCTINDLWDRDLDSQVARTKTRPLAAGILSPTQAVGWLAIQLSAGLAVLVSLPHTEYCFWWGSASLPLVVAYPLMKRYFDYPQLVLGLCFNWGAFMGWAAAHGSMDYSIILPLYVSGVAWTIGYDTLYAHQDKEDDAKLGLKSTAITFSKLGSSEESDDESRDKRVLYGLAAATYASWMLAGHNDFVGMHDSWMSFGAYSWGVSSAYAHLMWQIRTADLNDPHNLAERFRSNAKVGGMVFGSILAGKMALLL